MSKLERLRTEVQRAGLWETAIVLGLVAAQRVLDVRVLQIIAVTPPHLRRDYLALDPRFSASFAGRAWLLDRVAADPELEMTPEFVRAAFDRGDRCYVITDGRRIASYGWYSCRSTPIFGGLMFCFDPAYTYMYKGYTHPDYRGLRLHAIGMSRALAESSGPDCRGLVSFVERTNQSSLKSCYRMGYTGVTKIAVTGSAGAHRTLRLGGRDTPQVAVEPETPAGLSTPV